MIKSKRKTLIYPQRSTKATYKLDSSHSYDYSGHSTKLGAKYKSNNSRVNESNYPVTKVYHQGLDLVDV